MNTTPLIDQNGNHRQQHGVAIHHVTRFTTRGPERHPRAQLVCTTVRDSSKGELPVVELKHANHPAYFFTDMTPDDADQLADALKQAAQRAREATEALQARWGL